MLLVQKIKIKKIRIIKNEDVYDINVNNNHNFFANGILVHNCGEQPLAPFGSCNLGSINVANLVKNPFVTPEFDYKQLELVTKVATIMLDCMLDKNYMPLERQRQESKVKRQIGLGITGLGNAFAKMKYKYGDSDTILMSDYLMKTLTNTAYQTSALLANIKGAFLKYEEDLFLKSKFINEALTPETIALIKKYKIRNSRLITMAPTGTMSLILNNVSSGIEPIFALEYTRKVKQHDGSFKTETVEDYAWQEYKELFKNTDIAEYFVTAQDLDIDSHLNIQATIQKYVDTSISKTINVPADFPFEDFKNIYLKAWKLGLKGCTTYRPNSIVGSILEVKKEEKATAKEIKKQQKEFLEIWKQHEEDKVILDNVTLPDEYPMRGFKIKSEGKKWYFHLAFKDKEKTRPFAIFVQTNNSEPDVNTYNAREILLQLARNENIPEKYIEETIKKTLGQTNVTKIARILSLLLRHNVHINKIVKCLDSVDVPVSSFIFRTKKFLMKYVEEMNANGKPCPECGEKLIYKGGCLECPECLWTKCA